MLRLLLAHPDHAIPHIALRILDFYLLFPAEIEDIQMPAALRTWKTMFRSHQNKYFSNVSKHSVFRQLAGPQVLGLRLLQSRGLISDIAGDANPISAHVEEIPSGLADMLRRVDDSERQLINFLARDLGATELNGQMGLKKRTGLAEFRYDIA